MEAVAEGILNKYALTSPRERSAQQQQPQSVPQQQPQKTVTVQPSPVNNQQQAKYQPAYQEKPEPKVNAAPLPGGVEETLRNAVNRLRTNPASFAEALQNRANAYEGSVMKVKRGNVMFKSQSHEGSKAPLEGCIYFSSLFFYFSSYFPNPKLSTLYALQNLCLKCNSVGDWVKLQEISSRSWVQKAPENPLPTIWPPSSTDTVLMKERSLKSSLTYTR